MIKVVTIDDEPLALTLIETYCKRIDAIELVHCFTKTNLALNYLQQNNVDVLLLDINMPAISGIDFYKQLQHKPILIFTTSYSEYALESYDVGAIDYLLKPFTFERFQKAISRATENHHLLQQSTANKQENFIMLKTDYTMLKVVLADILFVEGLDNYLKIHLQNKPAIVVRITIKSLLVKLSSKDFIRVHRSYIVAVNHIKSIKQKIITIGEEEIPIGKNYEEGLKLLLNL
jgi:DNA-binding LytR/AlgR family response regulator